MPRWATNPQNLNTPTALENSKLKRSLTRKWYKQHLMNIADGKITVTPMQMRALERFAEQMGWYGPQRKTKPIAESKRSKPKPSATLDVLQRVAYFNAVPLPQSPVIATHYNDTQN